MATFKVAWNPTTRVATFQDAADALPAGSTKIADVVHDDEALDEYDTNKSHVLYHHVRDALYPLGVWDMQRVTIAQTIS